MARKYWNLRTRLMVTNALLFVVLYVLVLLNKKFLRPAFWDVPFVGEITGCLPNFLASGLISLGFVNGVVNRKPVHGRLIVYLASILVFGVLTLEEFLPLWGASEVFDVFDIVASAAGSLAAIVVYEVVARRRGRVSRDTPRRE
jgi:hypothetical protein